MLFIRDAVKVPAFVSFTNACVLGDPLTWIISGSA